MYTCKTKKTLGSKKGLNLGTRLPNHTKCFHNILLMTIYYWFQDTQINFTWEGLPLVVASHPLETRQDQELQEYHQYHCPKLQLHLASTVH